MRSGINERKRCVYSLILLRSELYLQSPESKAIAAKKQGTQVTKASFASWAVKFEAEQESLRKKEEEERIKALPPKEREEARRWAAKLTGLSLFSSPPIPHPD
jgi:hypothetical protein